MRTAASVLSLILPLAVFACSSGGGGNDGGGGGGPGGGAGGNTGGAGTGGPLTDTCGNVPSSAIIAAWTADDRFCLIRFATAVPNARQVAFAPNGDLFVAAEGEIVVLYDADGDGVSDAGERSTFADVSGGNHGLAVTATHVYASSASTVYRWTYSSGQRMSEGSPETVVRGIAANGHSSRTLVVDGGALYVSIGSAGNVDAPADPNTPSPSRAVIRRYDLGTIPSGGYMAAAGELFASGLRNEVGLTIDSQGRMWGVENGRDNLDHAMVGGDIHDDNPAEEVNRFDRNQPGRMYGYPFCWAEGIWTHANARGPGTHHLDPDQPGAFTEARCQDPNVVVPPAFALRAHLAPLDIVQYNGGAYPAELRGDLFVTSHGSWNRESMQVGRLIIRLRMGPNGPTQADNFLGELQNGNLREGAWAIRPVGIAVDPNGLLTFSDDAMSTIHKIGFRP